MKKVFSKKNKVLVTIIGVLVILSLNFFQTEVRGFFYFISSPIQKALWKAGDNASGSFGTASSRSNLEKKNEELKLRIEELLADNIFLKELEKENKELREALEIGLRGDLLLALAEIISKDITGDSLLINVGAKDGVSEGMPVITSEKVLLGKVSEVYDSFSYVSLISNKESSFPAKISESDISGVVKGQGNLSLSLDLVSQDKEVNKGDLVISTALGGIYPKGLLTGIVKDVQKNDIKPFSQISVSLFFDFGELENVFVILDF